MAARFWRICGPRVTQDLQLTELQLVDASGVAFVPVNMSASHAPLAGSLSALSDCRTDEACAFSRQDVQTPGFFIAYEFDAPKEVAGFRMAVPAGYPAPSALYLQGRDSTTETWTSEQIAPTVPLDGSLGPVSASKTLAQLSTDSPANSTVSEDGTKWTLNTTYETWHKCKSTRAVSYGRWYWEVEIGDVDGGFAIGIAPPGTWTSSSNGGSDNAGDGGRYQYFGTGRKRAYGSYENYGETYGPGDVIGIGLEVDSSSTKIWAFKNGVSQGLMYSLSAGTWELHIACYSGISGPSLSTTEKYRPKDFASAGTLVFVPALPRTLVAGCQQLLYSNDPGPLQMASQQQLWVRDVEFGGVGSIYGICKVDKSGPVKARVRLRRSCDGLLVRESWSKADGSYRFDALAERYEYDVEAWDHERKFFSVVANNQLAEVMS